MILIILILFAIVKIIDKQAPFSKAINSGNRESGKNNRTFYFCPNRNFAEPWSDLQGVSGDFLVIGNAVRIISVFSAKFLTSLAVLRVNFAGTITSSVDNYLL